MTPLHVDIGPMSICITPLHVYIGPMSMDITPLHVYRGPMSMDITSLQVYMGPMSIDICLLQAVNWSLSWATVAKRMGRSPLAVPMSRDHLACDMEPSQMQALRDVVARVLRDVPDVVAAYVYGSRVRGSGLPLSDLDVALVLTDDPRHDDPLLAERLAAQIGSGLGTSIEIDAHLAGDLPLPVRGRVVTQGVLIYERDALRRLRFETATRRLYFDFLPLLERDAREGLRARG